MKPIKKEDIHQELFELYDDYAHNKIGRRQFVEKLSLYAIGGLTVGSLLSFMSPDYVTTLLVSKDDARLESDYVTYDSPKGGGSIKALLSTPKDISGKLPGVIVVHENRGLNPYIEDVGRQTALAGFISIAPDGLSPLGGYPGNDDDGRTMLQQRDRDEMLEDFIAAFYYLKNHENCDGNIGIVGFCYGGSVSNMLAVRVPELKAAVPFYGGQPTAEETKSIIAPLLIHYAELDKRVNEGWPDYEAALKANDKEYTVHFYPDTNHGFHNTTTPRYDKLAAELAWERTIAFFKEKLV
ncbi:MAG: dienelactone hydrolase family protein [Aquaticitalea sp.]